MEDKNVNITLAMEGIRDCFNLFSLGLGKVAGQICEAILPAIKLYMKLQILGYIALLEKKRREEAIEKMATLPAIPAPKVLI